jgi:hypothetical protein
MQAQAAKAKDGRKETAAAHKPVHAHVPDVESGEQGAAVANRAPTVDEILDPERPSLDGASQKLVMEAITDIVRDIYDVVFAGELEALKGDLATPRPPEDPSFGRQLLSWAIKTVASWSVGMVSNLVTRELFAVASPASTSAPPKREPTPVEQANAMFAGPAPAAAPAAGPAQSTTTNKAEVVTTTTLTNVGAQTIERVKTESAKGPGGPQAAHHGGLSGKSVLDYYISNQRNALVAKKSDATSTLKILAANASGAAQGDYIDLAAKLRALVQSPELTSWFREKVAMEWMNFVARLSLGAPEKGQTTALIGANHVGGISDGGVRAQRQWAASEGMVEISLTVPDRIDGLHGIALASATAPSNYGAMQILKDGSAVDEHGQPYTLATLPVFRRVSLQTGASKLTDGVAFVITPEGQIEVDAANPALAAVGAGHPRNIGEVVHLPGGLKPTEDERNNPVSAAQRSVDANLAQFGARLLREYLRGLPPSVLK